LNTAPASLSFALSYYVHQEESLSPCRH
jgi:hypothetical protein